MGLEKYIQIAKDYSIKRWNFNIVKLAGEADGWFYFSCTGIGRPRWSSLPCAIRISETGEIEELEDFQSRRMVNAMANA